MKKYEVFCRDPNAQGRPFTSRWVTVEAPTRKEAKELAWKQTRWAPTKVREIKQNPRGGRYDRCVADVSRSGSALNPYAVCAKTLKPRRRRNPGNPAHTAYYDAIKADDAYSAELKRVYGKRAQEMRYHTSEHTDPALIAAGKRKRAADERFRVEFRQPRLKNPRRRRNVTRRGPGGTLFSLVARKSNQPPMVYTGDKFARHGKPVLFQNLKTAKAVAAMMQRQYPALRAYSIWARSL